MRPQVWPVGLGDPDMSFRVAAIVFVCSESDVSRSKSTCAETSYFTGVGDALSQERQEEKTSSKDSDREKCG